MQISQIILYTVSLALFGLGLYLLILPGTMDKDFDGTVHYIGGALSLVASIFAAYAAYKLVGGFSSRYPSRYRTITKKFNMCGKEHKPKFRAWSSKKSKFSM